MCCLWYSENCLVPEILTTLRTTFMIFFNQYSIILYKNNCYIVTVIQSDRVTFQHFWADLGVTVGVFFLAGRYCFIHLPSQSWYWMKSGSGGLHPTTGYLLIFGWSFIFQVFPLLVISPSSSWAHILLNSDSSIWLLWCFPLLEQMYIDLDFLILPFLC